MPAQNRTAQTTARLSRLLRRDGLSIADACKKLKICVKWGRELASRISAPTNPPVQPGGTVEARIFRDFTNLSLRFGVASAKRRLASRYYHSPASIRKILSRA